MLEAYVIYMFPIVPPFGYFNVNTSKVKLTGTEVLH